MEAENTMSQTVTIALNGEVHLDDFSAAIGCFRQLIDGLAADVASDAKLAWRIDGLEVGSAIATVRGQCESPSSITEVVRAYEETGKAIMRGEEIPYSDRVRKPVRDLMRLLNGRVTSIRFETEEFDAELTSRLDPCVVHDEYENIIGAVRGRVQSLSSRGKLRFTLYDDLDDHAISCYLKAGSEDLMRKAWGKFVSVEGVVRRSSESGLATAIRQITSVDILGEDDPLAYRDAIGCAPAVHDGSMSAEEAVRKIRND